MTRGEWLIYWVGVVHVAAYVTFCTGVLVVWVLNGFFKRTKLTGTVLAMYARVLKERRDKKREFHGA